MGIDHSTDVHSSSHENTIKPTAGSSSGTACSRINARMMQNVRLVWLDSTIDEENNRDYQKNIKELRRVVHNIHTFTNQDECITFLSTITNEQVCIILSGSLGQQTVPKIHDMFQIDSIFIFCSNKSWHEQWVKDWSKVKGVFIEITSICESLKEAARQCEQNAIPISFVSANIGNVATNKNLDQLDSSFMYTQIVKEILLTIKFKQQHFNEFIDFCYKEFAEKDEELHYIEEFKREYRAQTPIWWYTYESFLFPMLNRALREMEMDIIIKLGFFITDLHRHIEQLHEKQFPRSPSQQPFILYRGQGLSDADLKKLQEANGSLISFNNFLSTSNNRNVALGYAQRAIHNKQLNGILFVMTIDPSISTASFASINNVSYYGDREDEVLFAMHTIFRISDIKSCVENDCLFQVNLTLTSDNDQDLVVLTEFIRKETYPRAEGWYRLGLFLLRIGQPEKAYQVYKILSQQTNEDHEKAYIYHQLGVIKNKQGRYEEAITFYKKAHKIYENILHSNHLNLAVSYNNIGLVYQNMGEYARALASHEKAHRIYGKTLLPTDPQLATSYSNIGTVYQSLSEYSKALSSHEKALEIQRQSLPSTHPDLATSYNNIGTLYRNIGEYSKALSSHERAIEIRQQALPPTHPDMATSYNNIGEVYQNMGNYSKALSSHEEAREIYTKTLPPIHPHLATSYDNLGSVYQNMGDYPKALASHEKANEIYRRTLPSTHLGLATSYNNIGLVYQNMYEYMKALTYHKKALKIQQQSLPRPHPNLATTYNNIGIVYESVGEHSRALWHYARAVQIGRWFVPNLPGLQNWQTNLDRTRMSVN